MMMTLTYVLDFLLKTLENVCCWKCRRKYNERFLSFSGNRVINAHYVQYVKYIKSAIYIQWKTFSFFTHTFSLSHQFEPAEKVFREILTKNHNFFILFVILKHFSLRKNSLKWNNKFFPQIHIRNCSDL